MKFDIKNPSSAPQGNKRIQWAERQMPVLGSIGKEFQRKKPFKGLRISACLHVTSETANLMRTLQAGGAEIALCASNPLSTQDEVAASLVKELGIRVFAKKGEDAKTYYRHIRLALEHEPQITMDDGADLTSELHGKLKSLANGVVGGTEETTTGVVRLRSLERKGLLRFPIFAVNDAETKHFFDNRYGTGQSTIDGILRATNVLLAGSVFVVAGYGWCGRGLATRARGMGAQVIVTETNPLRALEAVMDGFEVRPMREAASRGDLFVTVTGNREVIRKEHFLRMKDGTIVANAGHFNVEVDLPALKRLARKWRRVRDYVQEFTLSSGKRIFLLAEGRLVNLSTAEGHPASVMDLSFANQALCVEALARTGPLLEKRIYPVPPRIDAEVARRKLQALGVSIDRLTPEQKRYLASWELGT